jgi:phosphoglycerate kinase
MESLGGIQADVAGSTVLVRASLENEITAKLVRITRNLAGSGARVAVISGLGNPAGDVNPALSLSRFAEPLARATGVPVTFVPESVGIGAEASLARVPFGEIALLENLRFHPDESRQARTFAIRLSILADFYIDAGNRPVNEKGWQAALRNLLREPAKINSNALIDEEA